MTSIYKFGATSGIPLGGPFDKSVVGGKGAGLMQMAVMGLPVPPGFIIPVGYDAKSSAGFDAALTSLLERHPKVSVRSGAPVSMPGMMDTVLNLSDPLRIREAIVKVLGSAKSERAVAYKHANGLPEDMGTAVIVQAMVHGDKDDNSGTGVTFTRNPTTGKSGLFGEWLHRATGEDLVAGLKTPKQLPLLARKYPGWYAQLNGLAVRLETHFRDMQDIEWTVESGKLWLLQTRTGKRTAQAAVRIALDMASEGLVTPQEALARVTPEQVQQLNVRRLPKRLRGGTPPDAVGMAIVAGTVTGIATARGALEGLSEKKKAERILYTDFTEPKDYPLMQCVAGFITMTGGATSHAAVVARELGKPCIVGVGHGGLAGKVVTMCGTMGWVVIGEHPTEPAPEHHLYERLVRLAR